MKGGPLLLPLFALGAILIGGGRPAGPPPQQPGPIGAPPSRLLLPVMGAVLTQGYGCTDLVFEPAASFCSSGHFHSGIDLAAPMDRPVQAAAEGVALVANRPGGYGLYVIVVHGGGISTLYGHLHATDLQSGQRVGAGDRVGLLGSSGLSTGPHLHFEVRRNGRPEDPAHWLLAIN
jgi:murein DD-endopeptidase MepM/ murein hydrolase activator NlpD